ncbi:MAG: hypothetical protein EBR09_09775 [Proteobacteria bacterium]|nr:hypothetical protein [Pseudomonadota bacterium]
MLGLYNYSEICRSLVHVCDPETLGRYGLTPKGLRMSLQSRAQQFEPDLPVWDTESTVIVSASTTEKMLSGLFSGTPEKDAESDSLPTAEGRRRLNSGRISEALALLQSMDPHLTEIMNVAISCIFTGRPEAVQDAGVSPAAPGVIRANPELHRSLWETVEYLVGCISKSLMIYDEFGQLHFHSRHALTRPNAYAQGALALRDFPLDTVMRSIAEGIAILNLRANALFQNLGLRQPICMNSKLYPDSRTLTRQIRTAIQSIKSNSTAMSLLSIRGQELLSRAQKRVEEFADVSLAMQC